MKCPVCNADNFYQGFFGRGECWNNRCELYTQKAYEDRMETAAKVVTGRSLPKPADSTASQGGRWVDPGQSGPTDSPQSGSQPPDFETDRVTPVYDYKALQDLLDKLSTMAQMLILAGAQSQYRRTHDSPQYRPPVHAGRAGAVCATPALEGLLCELEATLHDARDELEGILARHGQFPRTAESVVHSSKYWSIPSLPYRTDTAHGPSGGATPQIVWGPANTKAEVEPPHSGCPAASDGKDPHR